MSKSYADYELESGFFERGRAVIVDAKFEPTPNSKYAEMGGDAVGLTLVLQTEDGETVNQWYSAGGNKGWIASPDKSSITSEINPESHRYNKNSKAGILVGEMIKAVGKGNEKAGVKFFIDKDVLMTEAAFFKGLDFNWEPLKRSYEIDGRKIDSSVIVPIEFLGEASGTTTETKASTAAQNTELDDMIIELAVGKSDRELKSAAIKVPEIKADKTYMDAIVDGSKLTELVNAGKLEKAPNGKYI
jgi:hypothetical protein